MNKNNIVLIGFMGSGKTTFGKWLAKEHGYDFVDTDDMIEKQEKRSINEIFATDGEGYFRDLETDILKTILADDRKLVVSVGGGLPVREENRRLMRDIGTVVYLDTDIDELERRLKGDKKRPLLAGGDVREKIAGLMEKREDIYRDAADIRAVTTGKSFEQIFAQIIKDC